MNHNPGNRNDANADYLLQNLIHANFCGRAGQPTNLSARQSFVFELHDSLRKTVPCRKSSFNFGVQKLSWSHTGTKQAGRDDDTQRTNKHSGHDRAPSVPWPARGETFHVAGRQKPRIKRRTYLFLLHDGSPQRQDSAGPSPFGHEWSWGK